MIFGKMFLNTKCLFWFSLQLLSETFIILSRIQRDIIINVLRCSSKTPVVCQILVKFEQSRQICEKSSSIKFHENPSSGSQIVPCGQTVMTKVIIAVGSFADSSKTYDVTMTANVALNVLTLGGMDRTCNIPRHIPKEVVIGVIRSGRLGFTCKNT
jgi:hypothetical protein